jgi:hypothetical protein
MALMSLETHFLKDRETFSVDLKNFFTLKNQKKD